MEVCDYALQNRILLFGSESLMFICGNLFNIQLYLMAGSQVIDWELNLSQIHILTVLALWSLVYKFPKCQKEFRNMVNDKQHTRIKRWARAIHIVHTTLVGLWDKPQ